MMLIFFPPHTSQLWLLVVPFFQEKSRAYKAAKQSRTRFSGFILPHQILPEFHYSMPGLFLETTLVVLEELRVQCRPVLHDNFHWHCFWSNFLEQGRQSVSHKIFFSFSWSISTSRWFNSHFVYDFCTEEPSKSWIICLEPHMLLFSSLVPSMLLPCSQLCRSREPSSTAKEQPECIQKCLTR